MRPLRDYRSVPWALSVWWRYSLCDSIVVSNKYEMVDRGGIKPQRDSYSSVRVRQHLSAHLGFSATASFWTLARIVKNSVYASSCLFVSDIFNEVTGRGVQQIRREIQNRFWSLRASKLVVLVCLSVNPEFTSHVCLCDASGKS